MKKHRVINTPVMAFLNGFASGLSEGTEDYYTCKKIEDKEGYKRFLEIKDIDLLLKNVHSSETMNMICSGIYALMAFYKEKVEVIYNSMISHIEISKFGHTFYILDLEQLDFSCLDKLCYSLVLESGILLNIMKTNNISDVLNTESLEQIRLAI